MLAIGNEILRGDVENSNTRWLGQRMTARGAFVVHIAIVRDEIDHIGREFHQALAYHPRLLITTGGLGPTADDLTMEAIARAARRPLEVNPVAQELVASRYAELHASGQVTTAQMTPSRLKMATLPRGATPLTNQVGTAPGVCLELDGATVVSLPGVPRELYHIVETSLAPVLDRVLGEGVQRELVRLAGTSDESTLSEALGQVQGRHPAIYVKSHAGAFRADAQFRITLSTIAGSVEEAEEALRLADADLRKSLEARGIPVRSDAP